MSAFWVKKIFVSYENGCIFASAFAQKTGVEKSEENIEILEHEIACVKSHIYKVCDTTQMSSRLEDVGRDSDTPKIKFLQ